MAQVISTLCDECLEGGSEVPGDTWGLTVEAPGSKPAPYLVDACPMHAEPYRAVLKAVAEYGRRADRKPPLPRGATAAGMDTCPMDGCVYVPVSRDSLRAHLKTQHDTTLTEVGLSRSSVPADGQPVVCGHCGREFVKPQGLARHMSTIHGVAGKSRQTQAARAAQGHE